MGVRINEDIYQTISYNSISYELQREMNYLTRSVPSPIHGILSINTGSSTSSSFTFLPLLPSCCPHGDLKPGVCRSDSTLAETDRLPNNEVLPSPSFIFNVAKSVASCVGYRKIYQHYQICMTMHNFDKTCPLLMNK